MGVAVRLSQGDQSDGADLWRVRECRQHSWHLVFGTPVPGEELGGLGGRGQLEWSTVPQLSPDSHHLGNTNRQEVQDETTLKYFSTKATFVMNSLCWSY